MDWSVETVMEEVDALKSIFVNELKVVTDKDDRPTELSIRLNPATAENEAAQYVCANLQLNLPLDYPRVSPQFSLHNPRGLSDETLRRLLNTCSKKAEELQGMPVLYELIEVVRDGLTCCNIPSGNCCICLYGFSEEDVFTRTPCYHYFHSKCLGQYVASSLQYIKEEEQRDKIERPNVIQRTTKQVVCPVCREVLSYDADELLSAPPSTCSPAVVDFMPPPELRDLQKKMASLRISQKEKGGLIDVDGDRLFLITENSKELKDEADTAVERKEEEEETQSGIQDIEEKATDEMEEVNVNTNQSHERDNPDRGKNYRRMRYTGRYRNQGRANRWNYRDRYRNNYDGRPPYKQSSEQRDDEPRYQRRRGGYYRRANYYSAPSHYHQPNNASDYRQKDDDKRYNRERSDNRGGYSRRGFHEHRSSKNSGAGLHEHRSNYSEQRSNYGEQRSNYGEQRSNYSEHRSNYSEHKSNYGEHRSNKDNQTESIQHRSYKDNRTGSHEQHRSNNDSGRRFHEHRINKDSHEHRNNNDGRARFQEGKSSRTGLHEHKINQDNETELSERNTHGGIGVLEHRNSNDGEREYQKQRNSRDSGAKYHKQRRNRDNQTSETRSNLKISEDVDNDPPRKIYSSRYFRRRKPETTTPNIPPGFKHPPSSSSS